MKLIELLARELKEWPEGVPTIDQSIVDGELYGRNVGGMLIWRNLVEGVEIASDACTAKVKQSEWEAAVGGRLTRPLPTPTLETMLTEWRDLEARAQAAQAEADALFEHAGQCHGEIVVRLAELGWGAPRGPMVPGEPVVTLDTPLDMTDWRNWQVGDIVEVRDERFDSKARLGRYPILEIEEDDTNRNVSVIDTLIWPWNDQLKWISRPSTQP